LTESDGALSAGATASEATLRRIHAASLANLPTALDPEKSGVEFIRILRDTTILFWNHAAEDSTASGRVNVVASTGARMDDDEARELKVV
jgi:hypothetical protein